MTMTLDGTNGVTFNDTSLQGAAASPYVLKNRIINGAMVIDQRNAGASVTINTSSNTYCLDRWLGNGQATDGVFTIQQSSTTPQGFSKSLLVTVTTADASIGASQRYLLGQPIEGFNVADLGWGTANAQTVTLSFQVRSSLTGTFSGAIVNSAFDRSYQFSYSISTANTWTTVSITIAGDTSGTWLTDNGVGLRLYFNLGAGSSVLGAAGSWSSNLYWGTTGSVNLIGTASATWYVTGVQLEIGSTATPFERRLYNQELANCQRYYYQTDIVKAAPMGRGAVGTSGAARIVWMFPTTMRAAPTFAYSGTFDATTGYSGIPLSDTMKSTYATISSTTSATSGTVLFMDGSTGYLTFSAEL